MDGGAQGIKELPLLLELCQVVMDLARREAFTLGKPGEVFGGWKGLHEAYQRPKAKHEAAKTGGQLHVGFGDVNGTNKRVCVEGDQRATSVWACPT